MTSSGSCQEFHDHLLVKPPKGNHFKIKKPPPQDLRLCADSRAATADDLEDLLTFYGAQAESDNFLAKLRLKNRILIYYDLLEFDLNKPDDDMSFLYFAPSKEPHIGKSKNEVPKVGTKSTNISVASDVIAKPKNKSTKAKSKQHIAVPNSTFCEEDAVLNRRRRSQSYNNKPVLPPPPAKDRARSVAPLRPYRKCRDKTPNYVEFDDTTTRRGRRMLYVPQYCVDCDAEVIGVCTTHNVPLEFVSDNLLPKYTIDRARKSCPPGISVADSFLWKAGKGVWTDVPIKKGTVFGPYEGRLRDDLHLFPDDSHEGDYAWKLDERLWVDGRDESVSNWLRYVNNAEWTDEVNLRPVMLRKDQMFYVACMDIKPGFELLTWYGAEYSKFLGCLDRPRNRVRLTETVHSCDACDIHFTCGFKLDKHQNRCGNAKPDDEFKKHEEEKGKPFIGIPEYFFPYEMCFCPKHDVPRDRKIKYVSYNGLTGPAVFEAIRKESEKKEVAEEPETPVDVAECRLCGKKSKSKSGMTTHMRRVHGVLRDNPENKCEKCGKKFSSFTYLTQHKLSVHDKVKPFKCEVCGKSFTTQGNLTAHHKQVHLKERRYACDICDHAFATKQVLDTHKLIHSGEKPFKCHYCEAAFNQSINLSAHIRTHTKEKPYSCDWCGLSFTQSETMKTHRRTHTGEKPYKCSMCDYRFSVHSNRAKHERNAHK